MTVLVITHPIVANYYHNRFFYSEVSTGRTAGSFGKKVELKLCSSSLIKGCLLFINEATLFLFH